MDQLSFSEKEKIRAFDRLADCFFKQNFGTVGKSDIELLFFSILMEHLNTNNLCMDDYTISNILGITQQRVRNLKVKNQLRHQYEFDWKVELAKLALKPNYDRDDRFITVNFENPVLFIEIQHYVEQQNGYVDYALNPKLLRMKVQDFALLMVKIGLSKNSDGVIKYLRELYQEEQENAEQITAEKFMRRVGNASKEIAINIISNVASDVVKSSLGYK